MTKVLTAEAIRGTVDLKTQDVECPEWGGIVRVRELTGSEKDSYEEWCASARDKANGGFWFRNVRARLVAMSMIDDSGKRLFSDPITDELIEEIGGKSGSVIARLADACNGLSGFDQKKN